MPFGVYRYSAVVNTPPLWMILSFFINLPTRRGVDCALSTDHASSGSVSIRSFTSGISLTHSTAIEALPLDQPLDIKSPRLTLLLL